MDVMHEIILSDEKFAGVSALRDLLARLESVKYCSWGSFLSSVHYSRPFSGPFEILVRDELEAIEVLENFFEVDALHATVLLDERNGGEANSTLKVRFVDATAKNELMRQYLIEHSENRTCGVAKKSGMVDKLELPFPRRGPALLSEIIESDDDAASIASVVEKTIWSLNNVGVAPLLREVRFVPKECVYRAADKIEDLFVAHANKTASALHANSTGALKTMSAAELKTLGRPYAALLRA